MSLLRRFLPLALGITLSIPVCALTSSEAHAQSVLDQKYSEGFALQTLEPAPAGDWFFAAPDANVGDTQLYAMAFGSWAFSAPFIRQDPVTAEKRRVNKYQFYTHADLSLAIEDILLLNFDLPFVPYQDGQVGAANEPGGGVFADPRVGARLNLIGTRLDPIAIGLGVDTWIPIGSEDELASDGSFRANPKLLLSGRLGDLIYSASGGYLARKDYFSGSLETGPSLTFSAGLGLLFLKDALQASAEVYGYSTFDSQFGSLFSKRTTPGGALFGLKYRAGDIVIGAAAGPGLTQSPGAATRGVLSVAYSPAPDAQASLDNGPGDTDGDKIRNAIDACPEEAGPSRPESDKARMGCPKHYFDHDDDGLMDWQDDCPTVAGFARNGGHTPNGCPEPELDTDQDKIPDEYDACPDDVGAAEYGGCPAHKALGADEKFEIIVTSAEVERVDSDTERVVIRLNAPVELSSSSGGTVVRYQLTGAKLTEDTKNLFKQHQDDKDSALSGVKLEDLSGRVILTVTIRGGGFEPKMRYKTDLEGGAILYIDFPRRWQK